MIEITNKGYCSTKNQYYGLKLHSLAFRRRGTIPFPESLIFTPAEDNDLITFKLAWGDAISTKIVFGDKAYSDFNYFDDAKKKSKT